MKKDSMKIEGMTCSACANRIERVVGKLEGVEKASVNFATETLSIDYDPNQVDRAVIEETVKKAGYQVKHNLKQYIFDVKGMTCSACANRIEKITSKLEGVELSSVNFATEKLTITLDEDVTNYGQIQAAVEKAGYELVREEDIKPQEKKQDEASKLLTRFIVSLIFVIPLLIISMGHTNFRIIGSSCGEKS